MQYNICIFKAEQAVQIVDGSYMVEKRFTITVHGEQFVMILGTCDSCVVCRQLGFPDAEAAYQGGRVHADMKDAGEFITVTT